MAAASLHHDVLLDPEECYERAAKCADAHGDALVGGFEDSRCGEMAVQVSY